MQSKRPHSKSKTQTLVYRVKHRVKELIERVKDSKKAFYMQSTRPYKHLMERVKVREKRLPERERDIVQHLYA